MEHGSGPSWRTIAGAAGMILLTVLSFLLHKLYTDTGDLARDLAAHAQRVAVVEAQMGAVVAGGVGLATLLLARKAPKGKNAGAAPGRKKP